MANIVHLRARRFDALYQLLTGVAHAELPKPYDGPDHLRKDIRLPEHPLRGLTVVRYRTDPINR